MPITTVLFGAIFTIHDANAILSPLHASDTKLHHDPALSQIKVAEYGRRNIHVTITITITIIRPSLSVYWLMANYLGTGIDQKYESNPSCHFVEYFCFVM